MASLEWIETAKANYLLEAAAFLERRGLLTDGTTLQQLADEWPAYIKRHFDAAQPDAFYRSWNGRVGASNLVVNIVDQFGRNRVVTALGLLFVPPYGFKGAWLDFGCGTASISLSWQWSFAPHSTLYLADVDNLAREFLCELTAPRPDCDTRLIGVDLEGIAPASLDFIMSVDVLEHLPNPSQVFAGVHEMLRPGGALLLQAPWGGHPEHLDDAPIDWENNGGARLLKSHYVQLAQLSPDCNPSGVFWKKLS